MSPCPINRERLAELALGAMNAHAERDLQAHIESCAGCRRYLHEISGVTVQLNAMEIRSDIQTSECFHRRVVGAVRGEASGFLWRGLLSGIRGSWKNWRVALPLAGAVAAIVVFSLFLLKFDGDRNQQSLATLATHPQSVSAPSVKSDVDPTFANYQRVANRSLEKLDELLATQGNRNPLPTPIYTAAMVARTTLPD